MRRILLAILMIIVISFGYIGFTNMDTDANPSIPQETESY
jgi:hypothetical protein